MHIRVLMLAALFTLPLPLIADTTYTYTGNPYTSAQSPYTTSDFISGSFTVASPLAPNLVEQIITPSVTSLSFSDGVNSFSFTAPDSFSTTGVFPEFNDFGFTLWTGGTGEITQWALQFNFGVGDQAFVQSINVPPDSVIDDGAGFIGGAGAFNADDAGRWTETPEPSTLALVGTGIMGLAGAVRRRFFSPNA